MSARKKPRRNKPQRKPTQRKTPAQVTPPRIARVAKGKKPQYFSDPAIDKLLWMTITLMEELSVTRDRLDAVERLLDRKRVLSRQSIERYVPDAKTAADRAARRAAYVDRVLRALQAELEETTGSDAPLTAEEVVSIVDS
jgi:hypothetical protein